jgi:hypothetical protein
MPIIHTLPTFFSMAEFVLSCLDEDEVGACLARDGDDWHPRGECDVCDATYAARDKYGDPERVLVDCESKRKLVKLAQHMNDNAWQDGDQRAVTEFRAGQILRFLALPYSEHPDYPQIQIGSHDHLSHPSQQFRLS